ncbi:MAG: ABC transporter C-terminal domain-containing protein [Cyclobacteriaceae bacterium]
MYTSRKLHIKPLLVYEYWKKKNEANQESPKKLETHSPKKEPPVKTSDTNDKRLKALQKEISQYEAKIESLEAQKKDLENEMAKPEVYRDFEKLKLTQEKFTTVSVSLDEATRRWETLIEEIDQEN